MRKKIAIIHPKLGWGGSEATVLWMIEALKNDYDISLVTSGKVNIPRLNKYYGTNLGAEEFLIVQAPMPLGLRRTSKFAALRGRFIQRYCQKISRQFDLMIDAYSPCDFKTKGIQFATDIQELPEIIPLSGYKKWWYGKTVLRKIYLNLCDLISPVSQEEWKKNLTLSNSNWTARLMLQKYGIQPRTLYPPVAGDFPSIYFNKREKGFVCIGRIVPEKNIEKAVDILKKVRQDGFDFHLHIIGGTGDKRYTRFLRDLCFKNKEWLFFEGRLGEERKKELIASHQFGISCRQNEPFGIAVAEMVGAGCIVFVPGGGGQGEIVDNADLIYKNIEDAIKKIENVIKNKKLQDDLREHLLKNSQKFSTEQFKEKIKNIVEEFFNKNNYGK